MAETIGFVGIGNMGWHMAGNLVKAGHAVIVHDLNAEMMQRFTGEMQGRSAATLADLGEKCSVIITMLPNGNDVRTVMLDDRGLAESLDEGALLIDMSSSDPVGTRELGKELSARGLQFVDAPVSGGVPGARDATLAIMIGADDKTAIDRALPILNDLGKKLFQTGPLGSGHAMKALNNVVAGSIFIAMTEGLLTGRKFGLDPNVMLEIINASTGRSFTSEYVFAEHILNGKFATGFNLDLLSKDVRIAADLARTIKADAPLLQLASQRWQEAAHALGTGHDFTEAYRYWESKSG